MRGVPERTRTVPGDSHQAQCLELGKRADGLNYLGTGVYWTRRNARIAKTNREENEAAGSCEVEKDHRA